MKKILIATVFAILIVLIVGYIKIRKNEPGKISSAVNALPTDVGFFIQSTSLDEFILNSEGKSLFFKDLLSIKDKTLVTSYFKSAKNLLKKYPQLANIFENHNAIIAFRRQGKSDIDIMLVLETHSQSDKQKISKYIAQVVKLEGMITTKSQYNQTDVYILTRGDTVLYLSFIKGLMLLTRSELLLQSSIRQLSNDISIKSIPEFSSVSTVAGKKVPATLFINYSELWTIFVNNTSILGKTSLARLKNFANWTELDIKPDENLIRFYGVTSVDNSSKKFLNIFRGLEGGKLGVDKMLPRKTIQYIMFGFKNFKSFSANYNNFLSGRNMNAIYSQKNMDFKKLYGFDPSIQFLECLGQTITIADVRYNASITSTASYLIIDLENKSCVEKLLQQYSRKYAKNNHEKYSDPYSKYQTSDGAYVPIHRLPEPQLFDLVFGALYKLPAHQYYFYLDNYLVMSSSVENIKHFIDSYYGGYTLGNDNDYMQLRKNLTPKATITYFIRRPVRNHLIDKYLNKNTLQLIHNNPRIFYGINDIALQFYPENKLFVTYLYLGYKPYKQAPSYVIWDKKLKAPIVTKPFVFINHYTKQKEIFVGDRQGNVYLINRDGKILWSRTLEGPITGHIYMIDYFHNGKYQLLFNTKNKIYILDRLGRDVEHYPITLKATASAPVSVFDYEKDGNYRIFVPCTDDRVYLYTKEGKINPGWLITKTSAPVRTPVQHFVYKGRDYIVFADDIHTYILNRRGETRIPVDRTFAKATHTGFYLIPQDSNHKTTTFLTTNKTGKLVFINLKGKVTIVPVPEKFSDSHYFLLSDWDGNGSYEFIYLQDNKMYVYDEKLKPVLEPITFKGDILEPPVIYRFSASDRRVGFITSENLIYLINNKGQIIKDFPKAATTRFTITPLYPDKGLNILVGNKEYLLNYKY